MTQLINQPVVGSNGQTTYYSGEDSGLANYKATVGAGQNTPAPTTASVTAPQTSETPPNAGSTAPDAPSATSTSTTPPTGNLQPGSTGQDVSKLQDYLVQMGYLTPEQVSGGQGTYGPQTTAAVASLQKSLGVDAGSSSGYYGPQTKTALASKYQNLFSTVKNTKAPDQAGIAATAINQQTQPSTDPVYNAMSSAMTPILQSLNQVLNNINNPALTATSLQSEYNDLATQYNLPSMQASLLNMQNIMNGTTDDIRQEIQKGGGEATESQVLAMSSARNNVILKQYNALSTQYTAAQTNVSNMMQYATTDQQTALARQSATASVTEAMASIENQTMQMGLTMQNTARSTYDTTLKGLGYDYPTFASSVPDNMKPYAETLLGLAPGTLSNPAELATLKASSETQIANMYKAYAAGLPIPGMGATTPTTPTANTVVGGVDFGTTSTGVGAYASDITSEVAGVGRSYNDIVGSYGTPTPTDPQLQQYISNNVPNAPLTSKMISTAATQNGISPAILAATLNNETSFGTAGEALKGTNNPGGVMDPNTGTYAKYKTWQDGVNAAAVQLARRATTAQTQTPQQTAISQQSTQFQQWAATLPSFDGVSYYTKTELSNLPKGEQSNLANTAMAVGMKTISPKDSDALTTITSAQDTMNEFGTFIATGAGGGTPLLPKDSSGQPKQYADVKLNDYLQVNNELAAFNSWKLGVLQVLPALKGAGSGGGGGAARLFNTLSDLSFPAPTDTLPTAMQKIANVNQILMSGAKGILGNDAPFVQPNPPAVFGPQGMMVLQSDGTYSQVQ